MRTSPLRLVVLGVTGLLLMGACSGTPTLQPHTLSRAPTVDGTISEWGGALTRVGDRSVSVSAAPTDSLLYLAVVISDRSVIRSVAENGLVVWLDPTGGQKHTYGVRYPLGLRAQRSRRATGGAETDRQSMSLDDLFPSDLAVIRNDTVRHRMPAGLSSALKVQATLNTGAFIYEMAVPVSASTSPGGATSDDRRHGLRTPLGRRLSIGLVTPDPDDDSDLMPSSQGIPSVTGRGGRRRTRGRRRGRRRTQPSPSTQAPEQARLELWTRVALSGGS